MTEVLVFDLHCVEKMPRTNKHLKQQFISLVSSVAFLMSAALTNAAPADSAASASARYTFSWPLEKNALQPRGGSTRGAPVTLDTEPSAEWKSLQDSDLSAQERDRRAILAMAGIYRASFDFLEIDSYAPAGRTAAPYQSWGTEKVYVDRNEPGFISLVHILQMSMIEEDGKPSEPFVMKHWRQDWVYQPTTIIEYKGLDRWVTRKLSSTERKGVWLQSVYQVDESPRYASIGRWQHSGSFSTWVSADTWRPLPRREWSVRKDYQVLVGTNRHTINPTGWVQEENNLKTVLTTDRLADPAKPYLAREYGVARYERLRDADFSLADKYYESTRPFWNKVQDAWSSAFKQFGTITLRGPVDKLGLFEPLFIRADSIAQEGSKSDADDKAAIDAALADMGVGQKIKAE